MITSTSIVRFLPGHLVAAIGPREAVAGLEGLESLLGRRRLPARQYHVPGPGRPPRPAQKMEPELRYLEPA